MTRLMAQGQPCGRGRRPCGAGWGGRWWLALVVGLGVSGGEVAQGLSDDIRADQYRLEAERALAPPKPAPRRALAALEKYEGVAPERNWEFLYIYGALLVRFGETAAEVKKGHDLLEEQVMSRREGEEYKEAFELMDEAEEKLKAFKQAEAKRLAEAERARAEAEQQAEAERLAEAKRAEAERAEAERLAEAKRAEAERLAEAKRAEEAKRAAELERLVRKWPEGKKFRDCEECPEMVVVPAGTYRMGSPASEEGREDEEGPVHRVTIAQPLAVGKYEVTFAEWDACVSGGGCGGYRPPYEGWWGRGRRPVIHVSWKDAQAYVRWLSEETGETYRLLSEAEWEYVARAGTTTPFHTGATISTEQANYNGKYTYGSGRKGKYRKQTVPVGSFPANGFGLHDVHGNVWEWTQDCWHAGYGGAPADGRAWESRECSGRVLRGGSWFNSPWNLRSANRVGFTSGDRSDVIGIRVARMLTP